MRPSFIIDDRMITSSQLDQRLSQYAPLFQKHNRILVYSDNPLTQNICLLLCEQVGALLILCPSHFTETRLVTLLKVHQIDLLVTDDEIENLRFTEFSCSREENRESCLIMFTTGTTGTPKAVKHTWASISVASTSVGRNLQGKTWLMSYVPTGYAGLQVFFSAIKNDGTIVYVRKSGFEGYCRAIVQHGVNIVSATPTFWRLLISGWPADVSAPRLDQATLGGEIVTQDVLDLVDHFFKPSKLTHIYASTEVGTAVIVSDKKAGFPSDYFDQTRKVKFRICEDVLEVKSPSAMAMASGNERMKGVDSEGWISTGDVLEMKDGRYFFVGRKDGRINVGGSKVLPEEVEAALLALQDIQDCIVYEKKNPMVGALLASDVVVLNQQPGMIAAIKKALLKNFPPYKVPQYIRFVDKIPVSENGKKIRK